jgi:hypothetical protein
MPKILDVIEMGLAALRTKVGPLADEIEAAIAAALAPAKSLESVVEAEIAHLSSIGYVVTRAPAAAPDVPEPPVETPVAEAAPAPADSAPADAPADPIQA